MDVLATSSMGVCRLLNHSKGVLSEIKLKDVASLKQPAKCIPNQNARPVRRNHICSPCGDNISPNTRLGFIYANEFLSGLSIMKCECQFEWAHVGTAVLVLIVAGRAHYRGVLNGAIFANAIQEPRWKSNATLDTGEWIPQDGLTALVVKEECDAIAAAMEGEADVSPRFPTKEVLRERNRDAVRRIQHRSEDRNFANFVVKEA